MIRSGNRMLLLAVLLLAGCRQDMHDQPKYQPFEESDFFPDGQANRLQIDGTVARGQLQEDSVFFAGINADDTLVETIPIELDAATLARGRGRYEIYCSPCHDRTGSGNGMVVRRGLKRPESFHTTRLRQAQPGYFFQVMSDGFGEMNGYRGQLSPEERWAVAAYVRALQLSHAVPAEMLSAEDRSALAADPHQPTDETEASH